MRRFYPRWMNAFSDKFMPEFLSDYGWRCVLSFCRESLYPLPLSLAISIITSLASWQKDIWHEDIMMNFFLNLAVEECNDIVIRSEFYTNERPAAVCFTCMIRLHQSYRPPQLSNIYICYETNYNRIVE